MWQLSSKNVQLVMMTWQLSGENREYRKEKREYSTKNGMLFLVYCAVKKNVIK